MNSKDGKVKIALFPYNYEALTFCRFRKESKEFDICAVIPYQENSMNTVNKQGDFFYTKDARLAIADSDGLVLCDNIQKLGKKAFLNRINDAFDYEKVIYTSSYMYDWLGEDLFRDNKVMILNNSSEHNLNGSSTLFEINCPVISILGVGEKL